MYDAVVEVNDVNLPIWQDGERHECPAFALLENNSLLFGVASRDQARLYPLKINNRFVQQLSLVETPELKPHARHHADLCYRFLQFAHKQSKQPDRCVFVIPPSYTQENMAVLLGVVKQCDFDAVGLVDQAVAIASQCAEKATGVYCDLQLHQLVLGSYHINNGEVARGATQTVEQFGLLSLYERWIRIIAQAFIKQCRFDPLHDASVEQQLWVQLPTILAEQQHKDLFSISLLNKHLVEIPRADMLQPVDELFAQLDQRVSSLGIEVEELLCSDRLAPLPGLLSKDDRMRAVNAEAVAHAVAECQTSICSNTSNLPFVSRLPTKVQPNGAGQTSSLQVERESTTSTPASSVTHFVVDGIAYPLGKADLHLNSLGAAIVWSQHDGSIATAIAKREEDQWQLQRVDQASVWQNNRPMENASTRIAKGDRFKFSEQGAELCFIQLSS